MYKFKIVPERKLCIISYSGKVQFDELVMVIQELARAPDFIPDYNGISDERKADIVLSCDEANLLARFIQSETRISGRWAHLVSSPRSADSATEYGKHCGEFHENNIFSSVEAAAEYVGVKDLEKYLDW